MSTPSGPSSPPTRAASTTGRPARLLFVFYTSAGTHVAELLPGQTVVVGRDPEAQVKLDAQGVSRKHAQLSWPAEGPRVEDLGSTNGTRLNGRTVHQAAVAAGDTLTLGDVSVGVLPFGEPAAALAGLDGYERFVSRLEDEVVRAHTFSRPFGLVRVEPRVTGTAASALVSAVRACLRPVDAIGWYGARQVLALLPEADAAATDAVARALVGRDDVALVVARATYPADGSDAQQLLSALADAAQVRRRRPTLEQATSGRHRGDVVVQSEAMRRLFALAGKVAPTPLPVLILGETGSGKEVIARHLHGASPRRGKPFVGVNCAAIPQTLLESTLFGHEKGAFTGAERRTKGVFEQAHGGTVFLDEVGELSAPGQEALLRVLETRRLTRVGGEQDLEVDVRLLAATHRDLEAKVGDGSFRADLRFRLEGFTVTVPPLRQRPDDVLPLARHFLATFARTHRQGARDFTPPAQAALSSYAWPGNVRELRNVVERCVVVASGPLVDVGDLPERVVERRAAMPRGAPTLDALGIGAAADFHEAVARQQQQLERALIVEALTREGGNQSRAAKRLRLPLRTLVFKMKAMGIRKQFYAE
ncbi:MAG: sigma 54-interacting transcriptional regulator [Myxococcaceae bacterium]|nr:sigma 54-interacting transcriptional regulator [Myxococcaceae bacterium]